MKILMRPNYLMAIIASCLMLVSMAARPAQAGVSQAILTLSASSSRIEVGQTVTISIKEDSGTMGVNAIQANVTYPAAQLSFVKVDSSASAFDVTAQESDNGDMVLIARGKIGTTLTGSQPVAKIIFTGKGAGTAALNFGEGTALVPAGTPTGLDLSYVGTSVKVVVPATPTPTPTPKPTPTPTATPTPTPSPTPTPTPKPTSTPTPTPIPGLGGDSDDSSTLLPTLPETGAGALGGALGLGAIGLAGRSYLRSKRDLLATLRRPR